MLWTDNSNVVLDKFAMVEMSHMFWTDCCNMVCWINSQWLTGLVFWTCYGNLVLDNKFAMVDRYRVLDIFSEKLYRTISSHWLTSLMFWKMSCYLVLDKFVMVDRSRVFGKSTWN